MRRRHDVVGWRVEDTAWPVPQDALWLEGCREVHRLDPVPPLAPTLGRDDDDARERLWRPTFDGAGKPLSPPRWWRQDDFVAWLTGRSVVRESGDALGVVRRVQAHVGIRPEELTADEGILFAHDVLETLHRDAEWAIGAEVTLPDRLDAGLTKLGADGRLAHVESLPAVLFEPPALLCEAFRSPCPGLRVVAVTPLCFGRGWLPDGFDVKDGQYRGRIPGLEVELVLRAAFVSRPVHVSGWDMAAHAPKPTSRMVAPGAVYFFERTDGQPFGQADAQALWLAAMGARTNEGFGRVVAGVWRSKESLR